MSGPVTKSSGPSGSQLPSGLPQPDTSCIAHKPPSVSFACLTFETHVTPTLATDVRSTLATQGFSQLS